MTILNYLMGRRYMRLKNCSKIGWGWSRIYGEAKAWMLLPESYKEN